MMVHLAAYCDSIFFLIICKLTEGLKFKYLSFSLSLRNKSFIWNITWLIILSGRRRTSWLFHKRGYGYMNTGLPRTNPASGQGKGLEIAASRLQVPRPRFLLFLLKHILRIIPFFIGIYRGVHQTTGNLNVRPLEPDHEPHRIVDSRKLLKPHQSWTVSDSWLQLNRVQC